MSYYRKKPIVIEAVPVAHVIDFTTSDWLNLPTWVAEAFETGIITADPDGIDIATPEGTMRGSSADWLIRGVKGELYPCKPDIFDATYEAAPDGT
jgi:hypothetical protein